jgi:hypothetical protein
MGYAHPVALLALISSSRTPKNLNTARGGAPTLAPGENPLIDRLCPASKKAVVVPWLGGLFTPKASSPCAEAPPSRYNCNG